MVMMGACERMATANKHLKTKKSNQQRRTRHGDDDGDGIVLNC